MNQEEFNRAVEKQSKILENPGSYTEIDATSMEMYKTLYENAEMHTVDYGYEGKRFFNPLNTKYQAQQFRRRIVRDIIDTHYREKLQPKMWWMSKVPLSYYQKYGNWGDSKFTMRWYDRIEGTAESIKPKWA